MRFSDRQLPVCVASWLAVLTWIPAVICSAAEERPNIVLIFTDDQGVGDVGCYGSEIPTPHIDSIARDGIKFTNWYSASSICTPSRFGLLTGRNPSRSADSLLSALMFMADSDKSRGIQSHETTFAQSLADSGYATALIGKWHLGHGDKNFLPVYHGFELFKGHTGGCIDYFTMTYGLIPDWYEGISHVQRDGYATELITEEAVGYLKQRESTEQPFFLYLAYNAPHFGKGWSPGKSETVNLMQPQAADLKRVSNVKGKIRREFAAMVVSLDDGVGKVLHQIGKSDLARNTLVIFLTDHGGDPTYGGNNGDLRGNKATLFEGGIKVPCLMRWPGKLLAGRVSDAVTSSLDLSPTLCKLAGAQPPSSVQDGGDLSGHLLSGAPVAERTLYWETGSHAELGRGNWAAVRAGDWKLVVQPDGAESLFDLSDDPYEKDDLSATRADQRGQMKASLRAIRAKYKPPTKPRTPTP